MEHLLADGRLVEAILLLVLAEAILLALLLRRPPARRRLAPLLATLASGAALLLALRAALVGAGAVWIAAFLLAALVAHIVDLRLRLRP